MASPLKAALRRASLCVSHGRQGRGVLVVGGFRDKSLALLLQRAAQSGRLIGIMADGPKLKIDDGRARGLVVREPSASMNGIIYAQSFLVAGRKRL